MSLTVRFGLIAILAASAAPIQGATAQAASSAAPESASGAGGLEEIIVTAEKRVIDLQKAAAAITALSGDDLTAMGATDIRAVAAISPSTKFATEGNVAQQFIRGIGSNLDFAWVPEAVSYNVNGAPITRFASLATMYDVERIEVLPGPQGTLYGGSASGGVINIITNKPTSEFDASALIEAGNEGRVLGTFVVNTPLSDTLKLRTAINVLRHDGYQSIGTDDENSWSGRVSMLYDPSDFFSLYAWANVYQSRIKPAATQYFPVPKGQDPRDIPAVGPPFEIPAIGISYPGFDATTVHGDYNAFTAGAEAAMKFDNFTLTYLPAATVYTDHDLRSIAGFPQTFDIGIHTYTQELRANSTSDSPLQWIGGLYWKKNIYVHDYVFGPYLGGARVPGEDTSYAAYGQLTYSVTDAFRLSAGLRVSHDKKTATDAYGIFPLCTSFPCPNGEFSEGRLPFDFDHSWDNFGWKLSAEYDVASSVMLYATVQTGYNPGTFNPVPSTANFDNLVEDQTLMSYTAGIKSRWLDNRLQINDEIYYYDYKDLILQAYRLDTGNTAYYNAPKTRIYGNDLTIRGMVTDADQITLGLGLLHANLVEFSNSGTDYSGERLMYAPKVTASLTYQHTAELRTGAQIVFSLSSHYDDGYYAGDSFDHDNHPELWQDSYTMTDASLTYNSANGKWSVALWGRNLEDKAVIGAGAPVSPGLGAGFFEAPRTFGLRFQTGL